MLNEETQKDRILLGLLQSVERDGAQSQRTIASELGIALGLVNAYLKRCVKKGLVKVSEAPAKRYGYYLTPQGFAEKSKLTVDYLSYSFSFFRHARADCAEVLATARLRRWNRPALAGISDLAEVAQICAIESQVELLGIVDRDSSAATFIGLPVFSSFENLPADCDGLIVTSLRDSRQVWDDACGWLGHDKVLAPKLLALGSPAKKGAAS